MIVEALENILPVLAMMVNVKGLEERLVLQAE